jgi:hypothetical protein
MIDFGFLYVVGIIAFSALALGLGALWMSRHP